MLVFSPMSLIILKDFIIPIIFIKSIVFFTLIILGIFFIPIIFIISLNFFIPIIFTIADIFVIIINFDYKGILSNNLVDPQ